MHLKENTLFDIDLGFKAYEGVQWLSSRVLDHGAAGLCLIGVTALCPSAKHINPSLVLVQPRNIHPPDPYITERSLMGRKESI